MRQELGKFDASPVKQGMGPKMVNPPQGTASR